MAIDTAQKRRSSAAPRRLPWSRRFLPAPDGTIDRENRQHLLGLYSGIEVGEVDTPVHLCGNVTLLPTYNARVGTHPKYNASVQLLPTHTAIVKAREC